MVIDIYLNNYKAEHSVSLRQHFNISNIGVDYYTLNNLGVEFKETFSTNPNTFFKVLKHQFLESDLIVFCINEKEFYVHKAKILFSKYPCKNKTKRANLRHNAIKRNFLFKTDNYTSLKVYLEGLEYFS